MFFKNILYSIIALLIAVLPAWATQNHKTNIQDSYKSDKNVSFLKEKCELDDGCSCNNLGNIINEKASAAAKHYIYTEEADAIFKKSCDLKNEYGCYNLAHSLGQKPPSEENIKKVNEYYEQSCTLGHDNACVILGDHYMKQKGLPRDPEKAADLYEQACSDDNKAGCDRIARMYYSGTGRPKNAQKAKDTFIKSCDLGHTEACAVLSLKYKFMKADSIQSKDINFLNTQCLENKDANACYILGIWNYEGKGLPKNEERAKDLFQKSCDYNLYDGCIAKKLFSLPEPLRSLSLPF